MIRFNWLLRTCGVSLLWAVTAVALPAQTFTTLHNFNGSDGKYPEAGLVQATNGDLYGTTAVGGANNTCPPADGCGTVFKITPGGMLTTLHSFDNRNGANPEAGLVLSTNGDFYGTTYYGGPNNDGTVFKITSGGRLTKLYSFCSQINCTDGVNPYAGLIQATNGNFYGTTRFGGVNGSSCNNYGCGTVFKITPSGTLTTLHSFDGTDGGEPYAGLVQATDGNFYGTTSGGDIGKGTVFKITPSGTLTTLHTFDGTDGYAPEAGLVQGTDGNFYGTTASGGALGYGTVFKFTSGGTLTTLHSFAMTDGSAPVAALVQGTNGDYYGTTSGGGANGGFGTVFSITPSGTLTTLHSFDNTDGTSPYGALVQDTNGKFYGTATLGNADDDGTVFRLSVGLGPFVETQPASGKVGASVKILGTKLARATSVTFDGTAATFTVVSSTLITTTVPTGATTGTVQVVTPGGTLSSNVPFRVK
jgi:uncharacterized repeat protein (TIGR03803 family)